MNTIHICLLIGLWLIAIGKTSFYINQRDLYLKSNKTEKTPELKKAQKEFISSLVLAVIYTIYKLS